MHEAKSFPKIIKLVLHKVGKCLGDYKMIDDGDKILVGVSGGKDSIALVDILIQKRYVLPVKFKLYTVRVDLSLDLVNMENFDCIDNYLKSVSDEHFVIRTTLSKPRQKSTCFWCSWNRRKQIFLLAKKLGCRKVAFGHTLDDIVVTYLMNLFYHGEISTMPVKLSMFGGEIILIRPLAYVSEKEIIEYVKIKNLPVNNNSCPFYGTDIQFQRRKFLLELIDSLSQYWPNIRMNIFKSLKRIKHEYLV